MAHTLYSERMTHEIKRENINERKVKNGENKTEVEYEERCTDNIERHRTK